jgi:hypothetical protein
VEMAAARLFDMMVPIGPVLCSSPGHQMPHVYVKHCCTMSVLGRRDEQKRRCRIWFVDGHKDPRISN